MIRIHYINRYSETEIMPIMVGNISIGICKRGSLGAELADLLDRIIQEYRENPSGDVQIDAMILGSTFFTPALDGGAK